MNLSVSTYISAPINEVWNAITDFDNCAQWISAIRAIEVLEKQENTLLGLKWAETREMFGKEVTETMWISEVETNHFYRVQSESCGTLFDSKLTVVRRDTGTELTMSFLSQPQTLNAKIMSALLGWMMKGGMKKAFKQDLDDIKNHVENN